MTDDNFALRLAQASRLSLDDSATALDAMASLGYQFVAPGTPGRYLENTDQLCGLATWLRNKTALEFKDAFAVLDGIAKLNFRIREPDVHPSGLKTSELAYTKVVPLGSQFAAMRTIERSQFDCNGVEIDSR